MGLIMSTLSNIRTIEYGIKSAESLLQYFGFDTDEIKENVQESVSDYAQDAATDITDAVTDGGAFGAAAAAGAAAGAAAVAKADEYAAMNPIQASVAKAIDGAEGRTEAFEHSAEYAQTMDTLTNVETTPELLAKTAAGLEESAQSTVEQLQTNARVGQLESEGIYMPEENETGVSVEAPVAEADGPDV